MTNLAKGYLESLYRKSRSLVAFLQRRMRRVLYAWLGLMVPLAALKLCFPLVSYASTADLLRMVGAYSLILIAPVAGFVIAREAFSLRENRVQPSLRLAVVGRWKRLDAITARANAAYGPVGFMASLIVGMMMNVVFRTGEFMLAVPVMGQAAPIWGQAMFWTMTLDVVVTSFFYMVCFVMALRRVPLFPRMLVFAWVIDITMQLSIARQMGAMPALPHEVAVALSGLLEGNMTKVFISAAIWLPYLILSERVNVTYRHRTAIG